MIADNRVQMPAAQLTQAALQMPDRCSVSDIAQNPQLVVLADNPIDIGHDCFIVRIGVCGLAEIEPGIVKHHALRPILGGLASLRGEESVILRVPRVERGESAQHADQRMPEMRVSSEILHDLLFFLNM